MMINYDKFSMWKIFQKDFLDKNWTVKTISKELNLHKGTINRWILKKEVPPQYFNEFNRLLNGKYKLNVSKEKMYKVNDQFFTPSKEAKRLIKKTLKFIKSNFNLKLNSYTFIEPSAGDGSFYNNIPKSYKKRGLDIVPQGKNIEKKDWFKFKTRKKKNIVIGNPPFGLRGQLALKFINKSAEIADFICFVLPPLFNSNGKGSPMLRINTTFSLVKEYKMNEMNFNYPSGDKIHVNSIFQIWTKLKSPKVQPIAPPEKVSEWIKIYALSNGNTPSSRRNVKMIDKCHYYLPSTTFKIIKVFTKFKQTL